jgi:hypothetical protein
MMKLGTIEEEAAACRLAFEESMVGDLCWLLHHHELYEVLGEPAENRIAYILACKNFGEQALRLRLFRPMKLQTRLSWWRKLWIRHTYRKAYPDSPWDGQTIFAGEYRYLDS